MGSRDLGKSRYTQLRICLGGEEQVWRSEDRYNLGEAAQGKGMRAIRDKS